MYIQLPFVPSLIVFLIDLDAHDAHLQPPTITPGTLRADSTVPHDSNTPLPLPIFCNAALAIVVAFGVTMLLAVFLPAVSVTPPTIMSRTSISREFGCTSACTPLLHAWLKALQPPKTEVHSAPEAAKEPMFMISLGPLIWEKMGSNERVSRVGKRRFKLISFSISPFVVSEKVLIEGFHERARTADIVD